MLGFCTQNQGHPIKNIFFIQLFINKKIFFPFYFLCLDLNSSHCLQTELAANNWKMELNKTLEVNITLQSRNWT